MKLLPLPGKYRAALGLGVIIAACHSGESRNLQEIDPEDDLADSGSDASSNGFAGTRGISGAGGMAASSSHQPAGGADAGDEHGGTAGNDDVGGNGNIAPLVDGGDAEASVGSGPDGEGGPSCGDGNLDLALAEECDDGNDQHSDGCELDCTKTRVEQIALGRYYSCALSSGGGVKCWGVDADGSLGRGTTGADITHPSQIEPLDFGTSRRVTQISAGYYHTCVRFEDGKARCWGDNATGELGIGTTNDYGDDSTEPLSMLPDLPLDNVRSITAGIFGTCAIVGNVGQERMYCWGGNQRGEVGIGSKAQQNGAGQSVALGGGRYPKAVIGGWRWFCALLNTGAVRCWGDDSYGVRGVGVTSTWLGDNELPDSDSYNALGLPGSVTMISGTSHFVCSLVAGDVYCWGRNSASQSGYVFATYGDSIWQTPGKVNLGDVSVVQVHAGSSHSCALDDNGFVRCWGADDQGALGYPGWDFVGFDREPVLDYEMMRAGNDGGLSNVGMNDAGMVDAGPVTQGLPLGAVDLGDFDETPGPDRAISVATRGDRTCAVMESGALRCWGDNLEGLVGYPEAATIGDTESPAQGYRQIGYSDVNAFGPPPAH